MIKLIIRIVLMPFMLLVRVLLGLAAFITSIAASILGLAVTAFTLLAVIEYSIGYWQNGIAFMALALLGSPIGLPGIADILLNGIDRLLGFIEGLVCG